MTQHVASMFKAQSKDLGTFDQQKPAERIEACFKYLQICIACADACRRCEKACAELLAATMD